MEELHRAALVYYGTLSSFQKDKVLHFFIGMDTDRDGKVSFREFEASLPRELRQHALTMFRELDKDGNDTLDFQEAITCYYLFVTRRVGFCNKCRGLLKGVYYTCRQCFYEPGNSFDLCLPCYEERKFEHHADAIFNDNYAMLRSQRPIQSLQNQMTHESTYNHNQMTHNYAQSTYNHNQMAHNYAPLTYNPYQPTHDYAQPPYNPNQMAYDYTRPPHNNYARPPYNPNQISHSYARPPYNHNQMEHNYVGPPYNHNQMPHNYARPPYNHNQMPHDYARPPYNPPYNHNYQMAHNYAGSASNSAQIAEHLAMANQAIQLGYNTMQLGANIFEFFDDDGGCSIM